MTNETKQTAVEQLISKIPLGIRMQLAELGVDLEQAKEIEKEQTLNRAIESYHLYNQYLDRLPKIGGATVEMDFEQYYNETYKNETSKTTKRKL